MPSKLSTPLLLFPILILPSLLQLNSLILLRPRQDLNPLEWKFLDGPGKVTSFTRGYLHVPQALQLPTALKQPELNNGPSHAPRQDPPVQQHL